MNRKQHGVTLIGFILVMMVVGFFAVIVMKLAPIYNEYYSVVNIMKSVASEPGSADKSLKELQSALQKNFTVVYVESVKNENITLTTEHRTHQLNVKYEVHRNFFYNVDFVVKFDHTVELNK